MSYSAAIALWCVGAYIAGSIPASYLVARLKGIDIREHGSGNPGATNVFRTVGPVPGIIAFLLDFFKGFLPVFFAARFFGGENLVPWVLVGLCAVAGHIWTIFLNFKGGKGVATGAGVFVALLPLPTIIAFAVFALTLYLSGYVALGSICAAVALPVSAAVLRQPPLFTWFAVIIALLVIYRHKSNIANLIAGREHCFMKGKRP